MLWENGKIEKVETVEKKCNDDFFKYGTLVKGRSTRVVWTLPQHSIFLNYIGDYP
jgi:hypothetical protein